MNIAGSALALWAHSVRPDAGGNGFFDFAQNDDAVCAGSEGQKKPGTK